MKYRILGKSDLKVSCIGLGTWGIGSGSDWGESDENESIRAIHQSIDQGINLIDTAPCYNFGRSEEIVGKAIKGRRDQVIISTKCGVWWQSKINESLYIQDYTNMYCSLKKETIREEVELSLKRLGTDYIDIYHTHWPDPCTPIQETAECLRELQKEGKIRYIAVSNCYRGEYKEYLPYCEIVDHQVKYSMLDRRIEKSIIDDSINHKIGLLVYSPLEQGILTGKAQDISSLNPTDIRNSNAWFKKNKQGMIQFLINKIQPLLEKYQCTTAQLVIAWTYSRPGITSVLCGTRNPKNALENAKAAEIPMMQKEVEWLAQLTELKNLIRSIM